MPYKNKERQRDTQKAYRLRQKGITQGITNEGITGQGITQGITKEGITPQGITQYPALVHALVDPDKRKKLEKIYHSLDVRGLAGEVRYGIGGPTFDVVGKLLEIT